MSNESMHAEAEDWNSIRLRVDNVYDLTEKGRVVEEKRINGFPWEFRVCRDKNFVLLVVQCTKSNESPFWECEVDGEVKLVHQTDSSRSQFEDIGGLYSYERDNYEVTILDLEVDDQNLFVNGNIEMQLTMAVKGKSGDRFRKWPTNDFFSPSKISDAILVVEGKKLHVSKQILANSSPYFETLFYGDFKESQEKEIVLEDVSLEKFMPALELMYDSGKPIGDCNVENLMMVADRFDIPKIMIKAEEWLLESSDIPLHLKLRYASQYKFHMLQAKCVKFIDHSKEISVLKKSESYKFFSADLKDELIEKLLELQNGMSDEMEEDDRSMCSYSY